MSRWITLGAALAFLAVAALPCPAPACSLCDPSLRAQNTLRQEADQAKIVLYGNIANPQIIKRPGAGPGAGLTEFQVRKVLRDDAARAGKKTLEINAFLPVPNPQDPPRCLFFCSVKDGKLNPPYARFVKSEAIIPYLSKVLEIEDKDRTQQLLFFFKYVDDEDADVSKDAFLEFALCSDVEIGNVAKHLPAAKLRALLESPKTPSERLGLFAFLLGASGNDKGAAGLLRKMIEQPTERTALALDGLLSGYIHLEPKEGWDLAAKILADGKRPISQRMAAVRTLRFYHAWKTAETKQEIVRCYSGMLADGQVADLAIDDLRQWKMWDLTPQILAQYGKPSHDSPLARNGIIRYALCCPAPESQQFIAALRQRDPDLVRDMEESLEFEKGK